MCSRMQTKHNIIPEHKNKTERFCTKNLKDRDSLKKHPLEIALELFSIFQNNHKILRVGATLFSRFFPCEQTSKLLSVNHIERLPRTVICSENYNV